MDLITPDYGLLFWMLLSFGILLYILKKFAWKPILQGIKSREEQISKSLREAEQARNEIAKLEVRNIQLVEKAKENYDAILLETKRVKEKMIQEAADQAKEETKNHIEQARETIRREKEIAQAELKVYASSLALRVAEQILRKEFEDKEKHQEQILGMIDQMTKNN